MSLKLFHTADLHLSRAEQAYSLAVLEELVYHCRRLEAALWLFSGDVFDTHEDALALGADFGAYLAELGEVPVAMIPGNHDLSGDRSPGDLSSLAQAAGPLHLLAAQPFEVFRPEGIDVEVVGVPFRRSFEGYPDWPVPLPERRWRIGLLHGVVNGMTYTGESEEEEHAVLDPDLFGRLGLHYAALGHIHARSERSFGACLAHYPGSARVWRRGETGPRYASLVHLEDAGVRVEGVPVESAGTYNPVEVLLDDEGGLFDHDGVDGLLADLNERHGPHDWVRVELNGFLETREPVKALASTLGRKGALLFRRFEVTMDAVSEAERLRGHPLSRAFDTHWRRRHAEAQAAGDPQEVALLRRARRLAMEQIHQWLPES